jgi:hypothetical protein
MKLPSADFESAASASSAIPALHCNSVSWVSYGTTTALLRSPQSIGATSGGTDAISSLKQYRTAAARLPIIGFLAQAKSELLLQWRVLIVGSGYSLPAATA